MENVIITGACGFIGSKLVEKLISNRVNVLAIDIRYDSNVLPQNEKIEFLEMSVSEIDKLPELLKGKQYDAFYHLAWRGINGSEKSDPIVQIENIKMAVKCAETAQKIGCSKFLCAGTIAEWNVCSLSDLEKVAPAMMYGIAKDCTHKMLETYCKSIGLDLVWMQFSNIYGASNKTGNLISYTINTIGKNEIASFGPAMQPYDFIFVDDLIEAVYRLGSMKTSRVSYCISSGASRVLKDYLLKIGEIYNKQELIKIGERADDGIRYSFDMFDNTELIREIGNYITKSFEERIYEILQQEEK